MNTIVVGTDGSEGARGALEFAAHEAALRGARLRIVTAWGVPSMAYANAFAPTPDVAAVLRKNAHAVSRAALAEAERLEPDLQCDAEALEGQPGSVLVNESRDADLLVVGTRGHGGFASLLLGSVSDQCAQHAACPVVIVPHHKQP